MPQGIVSSKSVSAVCSFFGKVSGWGFYLWNLWYIVEKMSKKVWVAFVREKWTTSNKVSPGRNTDRRKTRKKEQEDLVCSEMEQNVLRTSKFPKLLSPSGRGTLQPPFYCFLRSKIRKHRLIRGFICVWDFKCYFSERGTFRRNWRNLCGACFDPVCVAYWNIFYQKLLQFTRLNSENYTCL